MNTNPMPSGERRVGAASLRVRQSPDLPPRIRECSREIVDLETPAAEQGKGYATSLMYKVCREADTAGLVLMLTPQPYGDNINLSKEQLIDWYSGAFGFKIIQSEPVVMARMPGTTPKPLALNPIIAAMQKERTK